METITAELEQQLPLLVNLLEGEVNHYRLLIEDLKEESECLKQVAVEPMMRVIKSVEHQVQQILSFREPLQKCLGRVLDSLGKEKGERTLTELLKVIPAPYYKKLKNCQIILRQFKEEVNRINTQNKSFIQDSLGTIEDLISRIYQPAESSGYILNGQNKLFLYQSLSVNRKV
jgi:hypothetical protein